MPKPILIVEDDADICGNLRVFFESEGFRVITASNGKEGLNRLFEQSEPPCMIFLDLMMPVMDGVEFLGALDLARPDLARIPVTMITAAALSGARRDTLKARVKAVVRKPFDLQTLLDLANGACA